MPPPRKLYAFTLAETLITLGIIGIVAALVIPGIVNHYQKIVFVNKLKKEYSLLNTVFKNILLTEGVTSLSDTTPFMAIEGNKCGTVSIYKQNCTGFYNHLSKYLKFTPYVLTKTYESSLFDDSSALMGYGKGDPVMLLADNSMLISFSFYKNPASGNLTCEEIIARGGKMCKISGIMEIDVNGLKKPNKRGRDVFVYYLSDDGNLYPYGGKDVGVFIGAGHLQWNTYHSYCGLPEGSGSINGVGCGARIMGEGWQMNY